MWSDLLINLVAEVIGIIGTVLVIDRIIQNREKKGWLPAKYILYYKLIRLINNILNTFLTLDYKNPVMTIYKFGDYFAPILFEVDRDKINNLAEDIEKNFGRNKQEYIDRISIFLKDLDEEVDRSAFLMEPELLSRIAALSEMLENDLRDKDVVIKDKNISPLPWYFVDTTWKALNVRDWIIARATSKTTTTEMVENFKKSVGG